MPDQSVAYFLSTWSTVGLPLLGGAFLAINVAAVGLVLLSKGIRRAIQAV